MTKTYLIGQNFATMDDEATPPPTYDAVFDITSLQSELISAGANIELRDGVLTIIPVSAKVVEAVDIVPIQAPKPTNIISKLEFIKRLTPEEYGTIKSATMNNSTIDYYWQMFMLAEEINTQFPDTIAGVELLEQAGLLGVGRAMEILS